MSEDFASLEDLNEYLATTSNWHRWREMPEAGAVALVDAAKTARAAALIQSGNSVSLSRPYPIQPGPSNPHPAHQFVELVQRPDGSGAAVDYYGIKYHGFQSTHLDALCHVWDEDKVMWGGRTPDAVLSTNGATWGGVEQWRNGILTRAVVADIALLRDVPYVDVDRPVHASEIEAALSARGIAAEPGDALIVHSGRRAFEEANPTWNPYADPHPGLAASCVRFIRENDIAVLCWDMVDAQPNPQGTYRTVHRVIHAHGVVVVDNCELTELAALARRTNRFECALFLAPLNVPGGTGSPVNPIAFA